jgi:hypothetical protein
VLQGDKASQQKLVDDSLDLSAYPEQE